MKAGQIAPRTVTRGLRTRAWWVMRRRGVFTLTELLTTLATGHERDAASNLRKYLRALCRAGILRVEGERVPGGSACSNGHYRYRLVVDNGRQAPVWRTRYGQVFEPNHGIVFDLAGEGGGDA